MLHAPLIYHRTMNPGGQAAAAASLKDVLFIDGANQSGKSYCLSWLIAACMVPHPNESGFSYWPCVPDFASESPWDNLETQILRSQRRFKLPSYNWLIAPTMELHREMAMINLPKLLDPFLDHRRTEWSKENKGIWDTVYCKDIYGSSRLSLRSWTQWLNNRHVFTTAVLDNVFVDEPYPEGLFGELLMRTATKRGRVVMSATLVDDGHESSLSHEAAWMEQKFIVPSEHNELPEIVDVINIPLNENPFINIDVFEERLELLSEAERNIRRHGRRLTRTGTPYFDEVKLEDLITRAMEPKMEGYLLDDTIIPEIPDCAPSLWYRVWEPPDPSCPGYLVSCDSSDGGDCLSDIQVWRTHPTRMVADASGQLTEDEIPGELNKLCQWYNGPNEVTENDIYTRAQTYHKWMIDSTDEFRPGRMQRVLLILEVNRANLLLNAMLRGYVELGVVPPLPRMYFRPTETSLARHLHFPSKDPGWETTSVTRPYLLSGAKQLINMAGSLGGVIIPDRFLLEELYRFVNHKRGQRNDRVIAFGLIAMGLKQNPFRAQTENKQQQQQQLPATLAIPMGLESLSQVPPQLAHLIRQEHIRYG